MIRIALFAIFFVAVSSAPETFEQFVKEYNRNYNKEEYTHRAQLFAERLAAIKAHNAKNLSWTESVNQFTDLTDAEFKAQLGYKPNFASRTISTFKATQVQLPDDVDWRESSSVTPVKNQRSCGSCWAFATAETLESHWKINGGGNLEVLSEQHVLDCTVNPRHCGGTGGCSGGTAEVAYNSSLGGLALEKDYPYQSAGGRNYPCRYDPVKTPIAAKITGFTKLPENEYQPLMEAVATLGPIAISVDASLWSRYRGGVFDGCNQVNPELDHAVQLVGYGKDVMHGNYWLVRNSWGPLWGESGYIRVRRTDNEQTRCGIDLKPADGSGCDGGPPTVRVCGTCGILYDNCDPTVA
eukprot:NODE_831_length_1300_cov_284.623501_g630_i0.p1 GENE.NODE_831_length_1300_cov_284.623501_g630_i0~~NODE_831_length_1300_cov_284.623501_g630_i0.p1  ORF type:complete len:370 (+),score=90.83 NODE_831_length_1300_cov_284.623501_g630_i0:54-1112(+)